MRTFILAGSIVLSAIASGCTPEPLRPTYQYDALYPEHAPSPRLVRHDFDAYAMPICGDRAEVLERRFYGGEAPRYVRIRFACP